MFYTILSNLNATNYSLEVTASLSTPYISYKCILSSVMKCSFFFFHAGIIQISIKSNLYGIKCVILQHVACNTFSVQHFFFLNSIKADIASEEWESLPARKPSGIKGHRRGSKDASPIPLWHAAMAHTPQRLSVSVNTSNTRYLYSTQRTLLPAIIAVSSRKKRYGSLLKGHRQLKMSWLSNGFWGLTFCFSLVKAILCHANCGPIF